MDALSTAVVKCLNHLLAAESWAPERLRHHTGAIAHVLYGNVCIRLEIDSQGMFTVGQETAAPQVVIRLPGDTPVALLLDRQRILAAIRIEGAVDIAETLGFVLRHLRWDIEGDLAQLVGDIAARRLFGMGTSVLSGAAAGIKRAGENLGEYLREDAAVTVSPGEIRNFSDSVNVLRDDLARLEKRLNKV